MGGIAVLQLIEGHFSPTRHDVGTRYVRGFAVDPRLSASWNHFRYREPLLSRSPAAHFFHGYLPRIHGHAPEHHNRDRRLPFFPPLSGLGRVAERPGEHASSGDSLPPARYCRHAGEFPGRSDPGTIGAIQIHCGTTGRGEPESSGGRSGGTALRPSGGIGSAICRPRARVAESSGEHKRVLRPPRAFGRPRR